VTKTDKSWRKKCQSHKNDAIALITIDVGHSCIGLDFDKTPAACEMIWRAMKTESVIRCRNHFLHRRIAIASRRCLGASDLSAGNVKLDVQRSANHGDHSAGVLSRRTHPASQPLVGSLD
jgi:hypothetical protein